MLALEARIALAKFDSFEPYVVPVPVGEECIDPDRAIERFDPLFDVLALLTLQLQRRDLQPLDMERALLVRDQHHALHAGSETAAVQQRLPPRRIGTGGNGENRDKERRHVQFEGAVATSL